MRALYKYAAPLHDVLCVAAGMTLLHAALQLLVYPLFAARLGGATFGEVQYLLAYPNVLATTLGAALGLARMVAPDGERHRNGGYHLALLVTLPLHFLFALLLCRYGAKMSGVSAFCYALLFAAMAWRAYAEVSFKLTLRYGRFFLFYAVIGVGYIAGLLLFYRTGNWPLTLLVGEAAGLAFAYGSDATLRRDAWQRTPAFRPVLRTVAVLFLSEGLSNLIFNADRLLLGLLLDASAVTVYYLATLVGKTVSLAALPLNGVLLGYLSRFEGVLTRRTARRVLVLALLAVAVCTLLCTLGGFAAVWLLYPAQLRDVSRYLLPGSLAQALYFVTSVLTVLLIRFAKGSRQVAVNGTFALCFLCLGIPALRVGGLWGFAWAAVLAGAMRFLLAASLCLSVCDDKDCV